MTETCEGCKFWKLETDYVRHGGTNSGWCRRYPPARSPGDQDGNPRTWADWYCGEYKPSAFDAKAEQRVRDLQRMLDHRDKFIVERGLWDDYVDDTRKLDAQAQLGEQFPKLWWVR